MAKKIELTNAEGEVLHPVIDIDAVNNLEDILAKLQTRSYDKEESDARYPMYDSAVSALTEDDLILDLASDGFVDLTKLI